MSALVRSITSLAKALFALLSLSLVAACDITLLEASAESPTPETASAEAHVAQGIEPDACRPRRSRPPLGAPAWPIGTDPAMPAPKTAVPYRGVNLAGAEFGNPIPGVEGKDYTFPTKEEVDFYMGKGMNTFRLAFKWERMQRSLHAELDTRYFDKLDAIIWYATAKGAHVILDPHNFARYAGKVIGSADVPNAAFADFWRRMAKEYADNPLVMFNLVNEPHTMRTEQWVSAANAAIAAIRGAGATNTIIVPGNSWTGAHSWYSSSYGTPNAVAMLDVVDPGDNMLFEAHQYLDEDSSGNSEQCITPTIGRERLLPFVKWLRDNNRRGFIGELAGGRNEPCNRAVTDMLAYVMESSDVLDGWLWWAGGPWWGDYKFTLEPKPGGGAERPQWAILAPFLF
ncbi:MAG: glycoside hydrolase family 5 protein [Labilithrix sp.]|nr:glycoside hydrolase family 5 protein [Labilithrix sp.]